MHVTVFPHQPRRGGPGGLSLPRPRTRTASLRTPWATAPTRACLPTRQAKRSPLPRVLALESNHDERMLATGPYPRLPQTAHPWSPGTSPNAQAADAAGPCDQRDRGHRGYAPLAREQPTQCCGARWPPPWAPRPPTKRSRRRARPTATDRLRLCPRTRRSRCGKCDVVTCRAESRPPPHRAPPRHHATTAPGEAPFDLVLLRSRAHAQGSPSQNRAIALGTTL